MIHSMVADVTIATPKCKPTMLPCNFHCKLQYRLNREIRADCINENEQKPCQGLNAVKYIAICHFNSSFSSFTNDKRSHKKEKQQII